MVASLKNEYFVESFIVFLNLFPNLISEQEADWLTKDEAFGVFPILKRVVNSEEKDKNINGINRYSKVVILHDVKYLVTTQWYWKNLNQNRPRFAKWLIEKALDAGIAKEKIPSNLILGLYAKNNHYNVTGLDLMPDLIPEEIDKDEKLESLEEASKIKMNMEQKIFFGAPGTGKSHKVNQIAPKDDLVTFRTTFHPDYDYAQFVGSYKPKSVCDTSSIGIQDPGNLSIGDLIDIAKKMHDDEIAHPYARLGTLYYKSLKALSKSMVGAKKEICDKSGDGMDNGPELNTGIFIGEYLEENVVPKETKITYSFVPQVFAKAYVAAWNKFIVAGKKSTADNQVYLVIEEINRGNCAQIFGDLFQLLDRDDEGYSSYEIDADADFAEWIEMQLGSSAAPQNDIPDEIRSGRKLRLPPNFNILATMNTSDQSLFPMDSAFKRRFDWEYVPIDFEGKDCASYQIKVDDENSYPWQKFVESVNEKIVSITDSEDKQLGEYFIKLNPVDNNVITKERFLGKVMFYLWNEVCKDVHKQESFFREEENGNYFTFQDLYKKDGDKKLISFMNWITK